jgi:hypothetical protein
MWNQELAVLRAWDNCAEETPKESGEKLFSLLLLPMLHFDHPRAELWDGGCQICLQASSQTDCGQGNLI